MTATITTPTTEDTEPTPPPSWWPPAGTLDEWEWATDTLTVINQVWARQARKLYWQRNTEQLRDDLRSWLTVQAFEYRAKFDPDRVDPDRPLKDQWLATLTTTLTRAAGWHYSRTMRLGLSTAETWAVTRTQDSVDRPLTAPDGDDDDATVGQYGRGLWPASEPADPLDHVIRLEVLVEAIQARTGIRVHASWTEALFTLDALAPAPGPGQCSTWGCPRPARGGRTTAGGLCGPHYRLDHDERAQPCRALTDTLDRCTQPTKARGLCTKHYQRARLEEAS